MLNVMISLFIKNQNFSIQGGLYRDDALFVSNLTNRLINKLKDQFIKFFQKYGLKITIDVNHQRVNFLDVTLDLSDGLYRPYMKPNNTLLYINNKSNHPPATLKNIPQNINNRVSRNSANEVIFKEGFSCILQHSSIKSTHFTANRGY